MTHSAGVTTVVVAVAVVDIVIGILNGEMFDGDDPLTDALQWMTTGERSTFTFTTFASCCKVSLLAVWSAAAAGAGAVQLRDVGRTSATVTPGRSSDKRLERFSKLNNKIK